MFKKVAVALSGGIDSAISALILKQKGFNIIGTFIRNWDTTDNRDSIEEDMNDAMWICDRLDIPFKEVNFKKEFWSDVVQHVIANSNVGFYSNPDIFYNEFIIFGSYFRYCRDQLNVDAIATGHYIQSSYGAYLENFDLSKSVKLKEGTDKSKDQSYILCRISQEALQRTMFPIGSYTKLKVKKIAQENFFDKLLNKKESFDICCMKSEKLCSFLSEYVLDKSGKFMDVDTNKIVGEHLGIHHWAVGQQCLNEYYVAANNSDNIVYVVSKKDHPALFCRSLILTDVHWIVSEPAELIKNRLYSCKFRFVPNTSLLDCKLIYLPEGDIILLDADEPLFAVAPGQYAVFYENDECVGSAKISATGPSDLFLNGNKDS
ncbi:hypothetical protein PGB90_009226 [Kerria lacca]